jgi:hypothetical protein
MKNSNLVFRSTAWFFLLFFLGVESGCLYYKVSSSKPSGASEAKRNLENELKQNKSILIFKDGNYYRLTNLNYNPDTTILTAAVQIDSSYHHIYNPYFDSNKEYSRQKGQQNVLNEVFIISDQLNFLPGNKVTMPLSSIVRIDKIKKNPAKSVGNVLIIVFTIAILVLPELLDATL